GHEPTHGAEPLEAVEESLPAGTHPMDALISKEEEAVLWRAIERVPRGYREALVLFYRERQSIESVAAALELSEEAVRQRLSRGRRLLQQEVVSFIEGALARSAPNQSFTFGVMAALPAISSSTIATGLGATAAKSSFGAKAAGALAGANMLAGPLTGLTASYLGYKLSLQGATSDQERRLIRKFYGAMAACIVFPFLVTLLAFCLRPLKNSHPNIFAAALIAGALAWVPSVGLLLVWSRRRLRELDKANGVSASVPGRSARAPLFEYKSDATLLGIPLIHIRFGTTWASLHDVMTAWIAVGDGASVGLIFAFGGVAIAPISFGGFALGALVFGGFGLGALCYAGFAIGICAVGGIVSGFMALGGIAIGWKAAAGGVALAREFAQGGIAVATHANDAASQAFCGNSMFLQNAYALVTTWLWPILLLSLLPVLFISRATRNRRQAGA
ncbi:MAG TPA: sigma-70 family RNA polymerase sigma factor, partial [Verrucomicrobiae bacterium]|nr:sigma-70 family RNA polymerase sigma factor [Verrucomicrobiae bacterium]